MRKNIANILNGAPTGITLWSDRLNNCVAFLRVENVILKNNLSVSIIVCNETDQTGYSSDNVIYFDEYGRILEGHYGEWYRYITDEVDLKPAYDRQWDSNGIEFLFFNNVPPEGTVIMDEFDEELSPSPWIIGREHMWSCNFGEWERLTIHDFAFDDCRFATKEETKAFFDKMHSFNLDFKDGEPLKINQNKQKDIFLNKLIEMCHCWKGWMSDEDYNEVIKKFIKEIL